MMKLFKSLKRLDPQSLWSLVKLSMMNPLFIYPTIKATSQCIRISTKHFGKKHMKNGRANAFRHAFWNYLIAKKCTKWSKNQEKILNWTKQITDWHEEAFKNRDLARLMDLHNNAIGRAIFLENMIAEPTEISELLLEETKCAIEISNKGELGENAGSLVYLNE